MTMHFCCDAFGRYWRIVTVRGGAVTWLLSEQSGHAPLPRPTGSGALDPQLTWAWSKSRSAAVSSHIELCYPFADGGIGRNREVLSHSPGGKRQCGCRPSAGDGFLFRFHSGGA